MGTLHICGGKPAAHSSRQGDPPCFHPPNNASAPAVSARPTMSWCWSTNPLANSRHRSKNAQHLSKTSLPAGPQAPFWPTWIALNATPSVNIAEIKSLMNEKGGAIAGVNTSATFYGRNPNEGVAIQDHNAIDINQTIRSPATLPLAGSGVIFHPARVRP